MPTRTMPPTRQSPPELLSPIPESESDSGAGGLLVAVDPCDDPVVAEAWARLEDALNEASLSSSLELVQRAFRFAAAAHDGATRRSGESYVVHPVEVAIILTKMQLDPETVAAALLHDVVEDSHVEREEIEREFGGRIARLVDGVTKLGRIPWSADDDHASREKEAQAESLRKMFLAMIDDVGVVVIKLADRLHNMRTLEHLAREKQVRIAQQTMEIYAPLANRLGIWQFKSELEDLALRYLNPVEYATIQRELDSHGKDRAEYIERIKTQIATALAEAGVEADLSGREKHISSIYRKMRRKGRAFDEIYDVIGIRILVEEPKDCYGALGVIHTLWHFIPGEFDDYIATPKESMYQSLHTAVIGPEGHALEIQIRTREMHQIAEYGVAAHWRYKEGSRSNARVEAKVAWLRQLMDWRDEVADAEEFVESLKSDVFQEMLYVFTPAGDIFELPAGATPVDFAYRIHTEVGHQCVGAKVNEQLVPLDYKLQNGQVVRILTSKTKVGPSRDWLQASSGYVVTASAREKIRQWFRRQERDENITQGKEILERELRRLSLDLKPEDILKHFPRYQKVEDLLAAIGYGGISPHLITSRLGESGTKDVLAPPPNVFAPRAPARLQVMGVGDLLTNVAQCCKPVNGDAIIGYVTRGRGITVHRLDCSNVVNLPDADRLVPVTWGDQGGATFPVAIRVTAWDRVGLLKDVSTLLADERVNILSVLTNTHDDRTVTLMLTLEVEGVSQLSRILHRLESVQDVYEVRRDTTGAGAEVTNGLRP